MKVIFHGTIPKDQNFASSNEDAYTFFDSKGILALSDGASESYDSKQWALTLTKI